MGMIGSGAQFRMGLRADEEGMILQLDHFHDPVVRRGPGDDHAGFFELLAIVIVHFPAMTVALRDYGLPVEVVRVCSVLKDAGVCTEAHGAAKIRNIFLVRHQVDDRMLCGRLKLCTVSIFHFQNISGKIHDRHLHSQTDSKERNPVVSRIAGGIAEAYYGIPEDIEKECRKRLPGDMLEVVDGAYREWYK